MDESTLRSWLDSYVEAWESQNAAAAAELFTETGSYAWGPFAEPIKGRDAIRRAWEVAVQQNQEDIHVGHEFLALTDDGRGIFRCWSSVIAVATGTRVRTEGVFLITLTEDNLCSEFREWWNEDPPGTAATEYQ